MSFAIELENKFTEIIKLFYSTYKYIPTLNTIFSNYPEFYTTNTKYIDIVYKPIYNDIINKKYKNIEKNNDNIIDNFIDKNNNSIDINLIPRNTSLIPRDTNLIPRDTNLILRDYQNNYINDALNELNTNKRCLIESPTGSGKTKMAFVIQSKLIKSSSRMIFVFVSPLLRINKQCLTDSYLYYDIKFNKSDNFNKFEEIEVNSSNNKFRDKIMNIINNSNNNLLLSTTYQSIKHIFALDIKIDVIILDESHTIPSYVHNTNYFENLEHENKYTISRDEEYEIKQTNAYLKKKEWYNIFYNKKVDKRLFLTATPYDYQSDNIDYYGKCITKVKLGDLIENKTLAQLKTFISSVTDIVNTLNTTNYNRPDTASSIIKFIKDNKRYRICIFVNYCKNAKILKKSIMNCPLYKSFFNETNLIIKEPILYLSGEDSILTDFSNNETSDNFNKNEIRIIISCKKLSMGIDIPCIDSIIFADPRVNTVDISQCIGRGLRNFNYGNDNSNNNVKECNNSNIKECNILLIEYLTKDESKNEMIYKYLDYLRKNKVFTYIRNNAEIETDIIINSGNYNTKSYSNKQLNIYDGYLELDIELYDEYSKYRKDINSKKTLQLKNFVKLLNENSIVNPNIDTDINKYKLLQKEYELPNINEIKTKYTDFGWILCNENHIFYKTIKECEAQITKIKKNISNINKNYEYMNEINLYDEYKKIDTKIPNIYYTDFYIPKIYNTDINTDITYINVNLNNYKEYDFNNYKLIKCSLENKKIATNLSKLINMIYDILKERNEQFNGYKERFLDIKNNFKINKCIELVLELCDIFDLNLYLEYEFDNKKLKIEYII